MTERDTDIEFDFFEEPETSEAERRQRLPRRRPPRPPRPPEGMTPLLRLVGLIVLAVAVAVGLVLWINSCRGDDKKSRYESYMDDVGQIATQSQQIGRDFDNLLKTSGIQQQDLQAELGGLAERQEQGVAQARDLDPPGPLRSHDQQLVEALQLRVSGLRGLADAFARTADFQNARRAGDVLAEQARRLVASDVLWDDLFKAPAALELENRGVNGVAVPDSNFLEDPELATRRQLVPVWRRIKGAAAGPRAGGLHGNGIVSVTALPQNIQLSTEELNEIVASTDLAFRVVVENSGESQEVQVTVVLTIQRAPTPIEKRQVIEAINAGQRAVVVFRDIGQVDFAEQTALQVEVLPVEGEENTANNTAEYPVIFSLPE